jgi:signal transduction histidine kinase/ligand-binding sensor domain-containing protein
VTTPNYSPGRSLPVRNVLAVIVAAVLMVVVSSRCDARNLTLEQLDHTAWTARDGAPLDIMALAQGTDGTLWIGATGGLYNFDGIHFEPINLRSIGPRKALGPVTTLTVSTDGTLWVGFGVKGIAQIRNHELSRIYDEGDGLPPGAVRQIAQAPDGTIMAIARNRLVYLNDGRWQDVIAAAALQDESAHDIYFDRNGTCWVATLAFVWRLPRGEKTFERTIEPGGYVFDFAETRDGALWMQTAIPGPHPSIVRRLDTEGSRGRPQRVMTDSSGILIDSEDLLWIASTHGILRLDSRQPTGDQVTSDGNSTGDFLERFTHLNGLTSDAGGRLLQDRAGNIWLGTSNGLDRFRKPNLVRFIDARVESETVIPAFCPSGELLLKSIGRPLLTIHDGQTIEQRVPTEAMNMYCDQENNVWIIGDSGFWRFGSNRLEQIAPPSGVDPIMMRQVVGDNQHELFASVTRQGLWRFVDGAWTRVVADGFPDLTPTALFKDSKGRLWAGFLDGRIAVLDAGIGHTFPLGEVGAVGVVEVFLESSVGIIAGGENGIAVLRGNQLQPLLANDRLSLSGVSGLLETKNGDLWLNGLHGIARISRSEVAAALKAPNYLMQSERFTEAGIVGPSPQIKRLPTAFEDHAGRFWFVTSNALVSLDPYKLHTSQEPPILSPITMTVDGKPISANHEVPRGNHTVRIDYFGVDLSAPEKVTYQYRLDGIDVDWQLVGTRSEAVYTGLRPGRYRFHVMASNGSTWTRPDDSLQFVVLPAFYETTWFLVLCAVGALLAVWGGTRLRLRHLATEIRKRADERADERIRIARDLHDTLLQGIQGLMLRFHVAAQTIPPGDETRGLLDTALTTADQILVEARDRVSRLRSNSPPEIDLAEGYARIAADINYEKLTAFTINAQGNPVALQPVVFEELYFIGREAITNAFRHADASKISVDINYSRVRVTITFHDNGCGFHADGPGAVRGRSGRWGISGMMERAHRIAASFDCRSAPGAGTTIVVSVPLRRAFLRNVFWRKWQREPR